MVYIVASHIEAAAFINDKMNGPADWYAEEYEAERKGEALAYFWQCLDFAIENRKKFNEGGGGDYSVFLFTLENPTDLEPKRMIFNATITQSGTLAISGATPAEEEAILKHIRKRHGSDHLITAEPITAEQCRDYLRLKNRKTNEA